MSEFSDSYHLLTSNIKDVKLLIRQSDRYGMVIPSSGKYIPFIVEGLEEAGGPIEQLVQHNTQLLIHYAFGADHACWINFFEKDRELACLCYQAGDNQLLKKLAEPLDNLLSRAIINESTASSLLELATLQELATDLVVEEIGSKIAGVLGLQHVSWLSCADTHQSKKDLQKRFSGAEFVNVSKRGQIQTSAQCIPNEWCSEPDQPSCMYLPVPSVQLTVEEEAMVNRHFQYWTKFGDYDNETQQGFWMYEHYWKYLPSQYLYLCNRLMNLYEQPTKILETLRAIIKLIGPNVNWEEHLRGF